MDLILDSRTRAQLRRLDPWEVRGAYRWVQDAKQSPDLAGVEDARLMALTPLVAEVREDSGKPLGVALRGVNENRIRRLLASDREDIVEQLARAVRLAKRSVGVADLVATAVFWGDQRRRQIAADYFGRDADDAGQ